MALACSEEYVVVTNLEGGLAVADDRCIEIEEVSKQIVTESTKIGPSDGILGGTAITGFIDIEKLIKRNCETPKVIFLEKKLPFSFLFLSLDTASERSAKNKQP